VIREPPEVGIEFVDVLVGSVRPCAVPLKVERSPVPVGVLVHDVAELPTFPSRLDVLPLFRYALSTPPSRIATRAGGPITSVRDPRLLRPPYGSPTCPGLD
jgi:hypothetical protein